jgi:membrane protein
VSAAGSAERPPPLGTRGSSVRPAPGANDAKANANEKGNWRKRAFSILAEAGSRWSDDNCDRMSASLAYYAIFSIFPLLLLAVTILGFFLGHDPSTREKLLASVAKALSPEFRALLDETLASMQSHETARGVGALVGVATLFFGASGVFAELDASLNAIWRVKARATEGVGASILRLLHGKAISFAIVVAAGVVLLVSLLVSTALGAFNNAAEQIVPVAFVWREVDAGVSLALTTLLLAVVYRALPRTTVAWRDVLGGAFLTAFLFSILKHILAWYLEHIGSYAAYGAVGAILGLLTWIYLVGMLLLYGAEVTRVYAEREGSLVHEPPRGGHTACKDPQA